MNIQALKTELTAGHPDTGPYNANDALAAAELNAENRTVVYSRFVSVRTMMSELGAAQTHAIMGKIETASGAKPVLNRVLPMLKESADGGGVDFGHANTRTFIDQLATDNDITADDATALKGLAEKTISRAGELGLGTVRVGHIEKARA